MPSRGTRFASWMLALTGCMDAESTATTFDPSESSSADSTDVTASTTVAATTDEPTDPTNPADDGPATDPGDGSEDGSGALCGDGIISGPEECDCGGTFCSSEDLGEKGCTDIVDPDLPGMITGGVLGCNPASCRYDTSMCTFCGDRMINGDETCEPDEDIETTCDELGAGVAGELGCDESCQIDTSACTDCAFEFTFELDTCPDGFTTTTLDPAAGASTWACGEPTVYALGPGVQAPSSFGTNLSGPYDPDEISALVSPEIDVSACVDAGIEMSVRHWHNFEGGDANADGGIVQVSEDGVDWTTIVPVSGAMYGDTAIVATYSPVDGAAGFSAEQDENQWKVSTFDLGEYAGSTGLQVRFVFGSDATGQVGGWYVDSVTLLGTGT